MRVARLASGAVALDDEETALEEAGAFIDAETGAATVALARMYEAVHTNSG